MKKHYSILSLGLVLAGFNLGFSQETKIYPCATDEAMEARFKEDPSARARYEAAQKQFQDDYLQYSQNRSANKTAAVEFTVPVVFHILHQGGAENVSDQACIDALKQVNEDFARLGSDTSSIFTPFKSLYINSDIKFMLAKKDPNGNCINGIVRHIDPKTNWSQGQANPGTQAGNAYWAYTWNPTQYLNIYVVANIVPQSTVTGGGIIVGYTYRPNTWPTNNPHDAIVYRYNYLNYGAPNYQARSLSHEIGHWLNLAHTFGNTNNPGVICGSMAGGDGISDTPDTKGNFAGCPAASTNTNYVCTSPDPSNSNLYYQNVQNIMDYSSCPKNFTAGQTNAMRTALQSNISGRSNLISASNLGPQFTDVNGPGLCPPAADFLSANNSYTVCAGGTLNLKDVSSNGGINTWQWTGGPGITFASPSSSITNAVFNTVGVVDVTLTVGNAQGNATQTKTVTVLNGSAGVTGPYMESFENPGVPAGWTALTSAATGWQQTTNAAYDQFTSFYIEGNVSPVGMVSSLEMPVVDFLNNQGAGLTFGYAYARNTSNHNDLFKVQFSKDCGGIWTDIVTLSSAQMNVGSGGVTTTPYIPSSLGEWKTVSVDQAPLWFNYVTSPNVTIRFTFEEAGFGNNFYLDAINFTAPTGVNELTRSIKLNLFPNPSNGESQLKFSLQEAAQVNVSVVDMLGKNVEPESTHQLGSGDHSVSVNKNGRLAPGVYFVNISLNGAKMSRKLVVE